MSINGQQGHAQLHRDDLESLAYTIIFLAHSSLPWISLSDQEAVLQQKISISEEDMCVGLPTPFLEFISHVRALSFSQKPDYQHLHSILLQCSEWEANPPSHPPSESSACSSIISDEV